MVCNFVMNYDFHSGKLMSWRSLNCTDNCFPSETLGALSTGASSPLIDFSYGLTWPSPWRACWHQRALGGRSQLCLLSDAVGHCKRRGSRSTYFCVPWDEPNILGFFTPRPDLLWWEDWKIYPNVTSVFSFFLHFSFSFSFSFPPSLPPSFSCHPFNSTYWEFTLKRAPLGISGEPEVYLSS